MRLDRRPHDGRLARVWAPSMTLGKARSRRQTGMRSTWRVELMAEGEDLDLEGGVALVAKEEKSTRERMTE